MRIFNGFVLSFGCAFVWTVAAHAQFRGGPEWATAGGDAQRSSWVRSDPKISVERIAKPGFGLAWKIRLTAEPSVASTFDRYIGYRGFRSFAFLGSASGELTTIDTDLGRIEWQKKLPGGPMGRASGACQGGMTANVARPTVAAFPGAPAGRGGGGAGAEDRLRAMWANLAMAQLQLRPLSLPQMPLPPLPPPVAAARRRAARTGPTQTGLFECGFERRDVSRGVHFEWRRTKSADPFSSGQCQRAATDRNK